jgi:hypothetical protein
MDISKLEVQNQGRYREKRTGYVNISLFYALQPLQLLRTTNCKLLHFFWHTSAHYDCNLARVLTNVLTCHQLVRGNRCEINTPSLALASLLSKVFRPARFNIVGAQSNPQSSLLPATFTGDLDARQTRLL